MRYVKVPESIALEMMDGRPTNLGGKPQTFSFETFAGLLFDNDKITDMAPMLVTIDLRKKLRAAFGKAEEIIELDDGPWSLLCALAQNPKGVTHGVAMQCETFIRAIVDAPTKRD